MQQSVSPDELRRLIIDAFPNGPSPFKTVDPEHEAEIQALQAAFDPHAGSDDQHELLLAARRSLLTDFCINLLELMPDQVAYALPRLMVSIIDDYPDSMVYADDVVGFLNVPSTESPVKHRLMQQGGDPASTAFLINHSIQWRGYAAALKSDLLSLLSRDQIIVIIKWLEYLRNLLAPLPDIGSDVMMYDIDAATEYWRTQ